MFVLLIVVLNLGDVSAQAFRSEEGPYQIVVLNTTSCMSAPLLAWFRANITSYPSKGQRLIRGTLSSTSDIKDLKFRVLMYYLEEKKTKVFDLKNQNCHNTIIELLLNTIRVTFNKQNCQVKAGSYAFSNLNIDAILHTVVQSLWYGTAQLRLEVNQGKMSFMCIDVYYQIQKIKEEKAT